MSLAIIAGCLHQVSGDYSKARRKLDWKPKVLFNELVEIMVREDLSRWEGWIKGESFSWDAPNYPTGARILTRALRG